MADYPELIKKASQQFKYESTAFAQITLKHMHVQAPIIARQFIGDKSKGDIEYGRDPLGQLFYDSPEDLTRRTKFTYKLSGTLKQPGDGENFVTIEIDLLEAVPSANPVVLARFLAKVDTNIILLPLVWSGTGEGDWSEYRAALIPGFITRATSSTTLFVGFHPLNKEVYFDSGTPGAIENKMGILLTKNIDLLENTVASIPANRADRILFHIPNSPKQVVGIFVPNEPIAVGTAARSSPTTWIRLKTALDNFALSGTTPQSLARFVFGSDSDNADADTSEFSADT